VEIASVKRFSTSGSGSMPGDSWMRTCALSAPVANRKFAVVSPASSGE
jgi:hypothetical protein